MGFTRTAVILTCMFLLFSCADARKRKSGRSKRNRLTCRAVSLVRYQMTVKTVWDKETFPKMFPTYRPPAHWSQLIGRSHGSNYRMWQDGANASFAVQKFAEDEDAEHFHLELSQGYNDVLDAFVAPDIEKSVGETSAVFSVDGSHPKVSFMMKIVPSPDWFIGLDSVSLCYRGRWKRKLQRDLRPFDAGTEQGLTFTSPHWPNDPQEPISAVTSSSPNHPAGSFFYPEYKILPKLATVEFEIISEYRLRKVHKEIEARQDNGSRAANARQETARKNVASKADGDNVISKNVVASSFSQERNVSDSKPKIDSGKISDQPSSTKTSADGLSLKPLKMRSLRLSNHRSRTRPGQNGSVQTQNKPAPALGESGKEIKEPKDKVDCQVSEWAGWSPCSQTCGFGNKSRAREALVLPSNGGGHCPLLKEESICGSMRNCKWKHFSLMGGRKSSPFGRTPKRRRRIRRRRKHLN